MCPDECVLSCSSLVSRMDTLFWQFQFTSVADPDPYHYVGTGSGDVFSGMGGGAEGILPKNASGQCHFPPPNLGESKIKHLDHVKKLIWVIKKQMIKQNKLYNIIINWWILGISYRSGTGYFGRIRIWFKTNIFQTILVLQAECWVLANFQYT